MTHGIVCFAKDWDGHPTSNTHVMRLLAQRQPVLWLSSIGMRAPSAASGRDLRRIGRKLRGFLAGPREVEPGLWVASPLALPDPRHAWGVRLNRHLLGATVRRLARQVGMASWDVWTFLPNVVDYLPALDPSLLVYYCVDAWAHSPSYDGARLRVLEARLCARADLVFCTSRPLVDDKRLLCRAVHHAPHGVDHAHFARAVDPATPVDPAIAALPGPVLAVVALVDHRVDLALLDAVAATRPDWTLAIVGPVHVDPGPLARRPNVRLLGPVAYDRLPSVLRGCAVGLVPFVLDDYTRHVNPIKLREYLSAGLPVVATPIPEAATYAPACRVAHGASDTIAAVGDAIASDSPAARARRSEAMRGERWEARVAAIEAVVARTREARAA